MIRTVFYDLTAGTSLAAYAYVAWTRQWGWLPLFATVAWVAVKVWIEHQEAPR